MEDTNGRIDDVTNDISEHRNPCLNSMKSALVWISYMIINLRKPKGLLLYERYDLPYY